jgi:hypothetical protein
MCTSTRVVSVRTVLLVKGSHVISPLVGDNVVMKVDELGFDDVFKVKSRLFEYDEAGSLTVTLTLSLTVA